jgi:hypothetical protein
VLASCDRAGDAAPTLPDVAGVRLLQPRSDFSSGMPCSRIGGNLSKAIRCVADARTLLIFFADSLVTVLFYDSLSVPAGVDILSAWYELYPRAVQSLGSNADSVDLAIGDTAITAYWDRSLVSQGQWAGVVSITTTDEGLGYGGFLVHCDSSAETACPYWARSMRADTPR